jgi:hypothetical protein
MHGIIRKMIVHVTMRVESVMGSVKRWLRRPAAIRRTLVGAVSYDASRTSNSILTSSLARMPVLPGGLMPKSVCLTLVSPV